MKRFFYTFATVLAISIAFSSCGSGGAKAVKAFQKVVKSDVTKKTVQTIGRSGDNVARHFSTKTVTCTTCAGLKQVKFVDDSGNYLYTGTCPNCDGNSNVTNFEFN